MKVRPFVSFVFLFFFLNFNLHAQIDSTEENCVSLCLNDAKKMTLAPLNWDKHDLANVTLATGATVFIAMYDEQLQNFVSKNQNNGLEKVCRNVISPFGNGLYSLPVVGGIYLSGLINGNEFDKKMAILALEGFVFSAGLATGTKILSGRERPNDSGIGNAYNFRGPFNDFPADGSFVSRHASIAFTLATILSKGYGVEKKWVTVIAYSMASMVALSRSYQQEHWASDIVGGAILGYVTGSFVFDLNYKRLQSSKNRLSPKTF